VDREAELLQLERELEGRINRLYSTLQKVRTERSALTKARLEAEKSRRIAAGDITRLPARGFPRGHHQVDTGESEELLKHVARLAIEGKLEEARALLCL